ncbi:MAG TPA: glycosyltransferase [Clostridia bacterium]|nr:glycosyltransferase [Clostridia bacterium]
MASAPCGQTNAGTAPVRPRVLAVIPAKEDSVWMIFARRQVNAIARTGLDIRMFYLSSRTSPRILFKEFLRFRRELREYRPDLVHAHFGSVNAFFCALATRTPLIITFWGSDLNPVPTAVSSLHWRFTHLLSQLAALAATDVICASSQLRSRLWLRRDARIVPTGVDPQEFCPSPRLEARHRLGWEQDVPVVLFNASNKPEFKGLPVVREAIEYVRQTMPRVRLEVMEGNVSPEKAPLYFAAADCLVLASLFEGSPTVVQEALACNLPVVSVDVGDVRERLWGVSPSRIVERNPAAIGRGIAEVLACGTRSNGRENLGDCAVDRIAQRVRTVYENVYSH